MATVTPAAAEIEYPESDGMPMAETDTHRILLNDVVERLSLHFADRDDVYVSGNLMVFYSEGEPHKFYAPDAFVAFRVPPGERRSYQSWVEGKLPDVVFEFTSQSTWRDDLVTKFAAYRDVWQVREYFLFDPQEEYLDPPLVGYRRVRGEFQMIKPVAGVLPSKALGLTVGREGTHLVLRDAATGAELPTAAEQQARLTERQARRAETAARRAETAARRAEKQTQRADTAEAEVARLKAELEALRKTAGGN